MFFGFFQRFVECSNKIRYTKNYRTYSDDARLVIFADFTQHLNDLNIKLQVDNKVITVISNVI